MNIFTYPDVSGKRHLRRYVKVGLVIIMVLAAIAIYAGAKQQTTLAVLDATPVSMAEILPTWTPSPEPPDAPVVVNNTETAPLTPAPCPSNPEEWTLANLSISDNFKRIYPACVYEDLAKTVAWVLASQTMGYTMDEASELLGFSEPPMILWPDSGTFTGMTDTMGPMPISISYSPQHPDKRVWMLDAEYLPGVTYTMRGCYRTYTIVGNERQDWENEYAVICVLSTDFETAWSIYSLGEKHFASGTGEEHPVRRYAMFGYTTSAGWLWIGSQGDFLFEIDDLEVIAKDRIDASQLHGVVPWDAAWAANAFGIAMQPLFDWQPYINDAEQFQAIQNALQDYQTRGSP